MTRSPLRRLLPCLLALTLGVTAAPAPAFAAVPTFTFYGRGYGHGIGLSQYGAQGFALNGSTYDQILAHYYQGTSLDAGTWVGDVEVNLDKYYGTSSFAGKARYTVTGINSALKVGTLDPVPAGTPYTVDAGGWVECADPGGVIRISEPTGPYNAVNKSYRGRLYFYRLSSGNLSVVDYVPFEHYLYGVVPCESPSTWNAEALKAQAVAARSYAHDTVAARKTLKCTTASQVYGGYDYEKPSTNSAVDQTAGQVVKSAGAVVQTFFFSASGGRTANIEDSWVYSDPKPYYTGVSDPYEGLANSPHSSWTSVFSGSTIASKLRASSTVKSELSNHGLPAIPSDTSVYVSSISIVKGVSGYPRWVTFTFSNGVACKLGSYTVKGALGMKAPYFSLDGSLSAPIDRVYGSDRFATAVAVSKRAFPSGAPAVVLASGQSFADALTGSGLAGAAGGAVLLTWKDTVPASVLAEIARLQPAKLYVMGGKGAVSDAALNAAKAKAPGASVTRVDGSDRAETARKAADLVKSIATPSKAIVAFGDSWPDAAAASGLSYGRTYPILLTARGALSSSAATWLAGNKPDVLVVGAAANDAAVVAAIKSATGKEPVKLAGADRFATAAAIALHCVGNESFTADHVYVATGLAYADALTGGVLAGKEKRALVLTAKDTVPAPTATFLRSAATKTLHLFGGTAVISSKGATALQKAIGG